MAAMPTMGWLRWMLPGRAVERGAAEGEDPRRRTPPASRPTPRLVWAVGGPAEAVAARATQRGRHGQDRGRQHGQPPPSGVPTRRRSSRRTGARATGEDGMVKASPRVERASGPLRHGASVAGGRGSGHPGGPGAEPVSLLGRRPVNDPRRPDGRRQAPESASQQLGDAEGQVEGLAGVEPGVAGGGVPLVELVLQMSSTPPRHSVTSSPVSSTCTPAGPGAHLAVGPEEPLELADDVVEPPGLLAPFGGEGVAVHGVADPDHRVALVRAPPGAAEAARPPPRRPPTG